MTMLREHLESLRYNRMATEGGRERAKRGKRKMERRREIDKDRGVGRLGE